MERISDAMNKSIGYNQFEVSFASGLMSIAEVSERCQNILLSKSDIVSITELCLDSIAKKPFCKSLYLMKRQQILSERQTDELTRIDSKSLDRIFSAIYTICRFVSRNITTNRGDLDQLKIIVQKNSKLHETIIDSLFEILRNRFLSPQAARIYFNKRVAIGNRFASSKIHLNFEIDVNNRSTLKPFIVIEIRCISSANENVFLFKCEMKKFHQLRFVIARLLNRLQTLNISDLSGLNSRLYETRIIYS
ncbi:hypothetical protein SSS_04963 [Sarcoptes scabiei]|uniref:COMM domain-containing protein 5 n=1 Tax=Sarcoptes scabiei TaxID=52283 RepID=A0A834RJJ2_SARSC|nr:hypothetical protein SSS_04963 [Sarcoptes scabiei]